MYEYRGKLTTGEEIRNCSQGTKSNLHL
jgi:hypothetical protein